MMLLHFIKGDIHIPVLLLLTLSFCHVANSLLDTITSSNYILKDPETLISTNTLFHLGFFTPSNSSTLSYLGIWYINQPIKDSSSGHLKISEDGNLYVMNQQKQILWSSNITNITSNTTAQLQNTGNLVLQEITTGRILWQSFQHPADTFLPKMELSTNEITGQRVKLTSWRTPNDPSKGDFTMSLEPLHIAQVFIWRGTQPYWRSGPWNGQVFIGIPTMNANYLDGFSLDGEGETNGTYYLSYNYANVSMMYVLSSDGNLHETYWDYAKRDWIVDWSACGPFGSCDPKNSPICSCLRGFEPKNAQEWNKQNWSSGCVRKKPLQCDERVRNNRSSDGFVKLQNVKVPDFSQWLSSIAYDCRTECLANCSCIAYAYDSGIGCMLWCGNLIDIQQFSMGGIDLYIRVPSSELEKKNHTLIIVLSVIIAMALIVACAYILRKRAIRGVKALQRIQRRSYVNDTSQVELPENSLFELEKLATATNNFHSNNKLGQGGFGSVYKGRLEDGQEIAVKRLSKTSGQGVEEFMNEVMVISKLQHRNLVSLLGCCIERDEKILIYEYLPNRSLDAHIFDPPKQKVLNWEKRFNILEGIARGLLYLHRDSRLKIIHRDLKLSNILLDDELNPKISDFGMAKIFENAENEANTRRIVGTFGYISPEYALQGLFSEKSDVFSFGVLLLEIISGRKNSSFYENVESLSLLGFAWKLWRNDNIASLIDPEISNPSNKKDITRCIHIGLLCVQELASYRPTMTAVISMLNSETVNLPPPKQPAFIQIQTMIDVESSLRNDGACSINYMILLTLCFSFFLHDAGSSLDTITSSYILKAPETLSSNDGMFHLGFFTPTNSTFSYLGIWYITKPPLVWVANRDQPIKDSSSSSSGVLKISKDGNLVLLNSQDDILWSTNASNISSNTTAKLLNTGNLVLQENATGRILWQSFQHPTNAFLEGMELSTGNISGVQRTKLTSWKSHEDASIGEFSMSLERLNIPEVLVWRGSQPHWRSGPWNGQIFLGIPDMATNYLFGFYLSQDNGNTNYYLAYNYGNQTFPVYYLLSVDGNVYQVSWDPEKRDWYISWLAISSECDVYGKCGEFGICDHRSTPICRCLRGYKPRNDEEWSKQNWSSGCVRKEPFQCESESVKNNKEDGFVKMQNAKVPASILSYAAEDDCKAECLGNCSCTAYAYDAGTGCMSWIGSLIDLQIFSTGGTDLYIRVPYAELGEDKKNVTVVIAVSVIVGTTIILTCAYIFWKRIQIRERVKNKLRREDNDLVKLPELSQFEFERLVAATNNFNLSNKLGEGGYGPVYKGTLEDGQEIAVKRLSRSSGQGYEEFMNEVMVISKLQHRNLVRLFGCCIEGEEKILIYEYMPNKSLDAYMFDQSNQILNWEKRFSIIDGIARGLLYLHRDSRLRIIHRDLKLSNILLDEELNPKIADFGLAKIFSRTEDAVNTRRVVGTYGYMSPEYAMEGLFSEKSDVFSFGVLLLEIVSRRKNTSFCEDSKSLSLLGFAWNLWNADNTASLIDPEISSSCNKEDIMRCIHIGLLCVQELARDRPTMTAVVSMLNSETVNLPSPKQPAFVQRQTLLDIESSMTNDGFCSINNVSLTNVQGR
ncbi:hypothetical protein AAHE18_20G050800 [Arachis hypogaea]